MEYYAAMKIEGSLCTVIERSLKYIVRWKKARLLFVGKSGNRYIFACIYIKYLWEDTQERKHSGEGTEEAGRLFLMYTF